MYILIGADEGHTEYIIAAPTLALLRSVIREAKLKEATDLGADKQYYLDEGDALVQMLEQRDVWEPGWHILRPVEPVWQSTSLLVLKPGAEMAMYPPVYRHLTDLPVSRLLW
jgi:hypothetical protein